MKPVTHLMSLACAAVLGAASVASGAAGDIRALGAIGNTQSYGYAINDGGVAAGYFNTAQYATIHAYRHDGTTMTDLTDPTFGTGRSWALGINAAGTVVGEAMTKGGPIHAFKHDGTGMVDLGTLGGRTSSGQDINASGTAVGFASTATSSHAFVHDGTGMTDLGTLGGELSRAHGINDAGVIVGYASVANGDSHAFKYEGNVMADLGTLGGSSSTAWAVNASGVIAGQSDSPVGTRGFRYDGNGMTALPTFGTHSFAYGINDGGAIVGWTVGASWGATLWKSDNEVVQLDAWLDAVNPDAGSRWHLSDARAISNTNLVTGYGSYTFGPGDARASAYVLDVSSLVPEPTSLGLLALGAAGLLSRRARSRRS